VAVGIIPTKGAEAVDMKRWSVDVGDARFDSAVNREVVAFIQASGARSTVMADRIIGCPHEEEVDYPLGASCPFCPYWAGRNRWTGEFEH
jgi:hypothetical protein